MGSICFTTAYFLSSCLIAYFLSKLSLNDMFVEQCKVSEVYSTCEYDLLYLFPGDLR
jgi:hypothetical protein